MTKRLSLILSIVLIFNSILMPIQVLASDVDVNSTEIVKIEPKISAFKVKWAFAEGVSGYNIQYSTSKKFSKKSTSSNNVDKQSKKSLTIKKLRANKKYYVRIRTFIKQNGKKYYSKWSSTKNVTTCVFKSSDIDPKKPMVALSFDDGPAYNGATGRILDMLEKYGAHATFFMVGNRINKNTNKYLKREIALGCELGNHTYNHNHYGGSVTAGDISKCSSSIKKATGKMPTIFRCPGGSMSSTIQNEAKKEGMPIAYWSVDTEDWRTRNKKSIVREVKNGVYDGSIILMHDIYTTSADAVEEIVPYLVNKGYQIVTVSELVKYKSGKSPKAGQQYMNYKKINNHTR